MSADNQCDTDQQIDDHGSAHLLVAIEQMARAGRSERRIGLRVRPFIARPRPTRLARMRARLTHS